MSWPLSLGISINPQLFGGYWYFLEPDIKVSARQFSQLPCFSSHLSSCDKTCKLKVTHLFLIFLWFKAISPSHGSSNPFYALCKYIYILVKTKLHRHLKFCTVFLISLRNNNYYFNLAILRIAFSRHSVSCNAWKRLCYQEIMKIWS